MAPERSPNSSCCAQAECIQHGLRTIAFCHTRKLCELVTAYTRETLKSSAPHLSSSISVYRAGYSPEVSCVVTHTGNTALHTRCIAWAS